MNKKSKCFILILILFILFSITSVSAADNQTEILSDADDYHSFKELNQSITQSDSELNLNYDYKYDNVKINVNKSNEFIINGNGHELNGIKGNDSFTVKSKKMVTINNLTFKNCTDTILNMSSSVIFNNVKFINCSGDNMFGMFIYAPKVNITFNNCIFNMNGGIQIVDSSYGNLILNNSLISGGKFISTLFGANRINLIVENTTFANITASSAVIDYRGCNLTVKRSKFLNLHSSKSSGAIIGKFFPPTGGSYGHFLMDDCLFSNVSSANDGGAIYFDLDSGSGGKLQTFDIFNTEFNDCEAKFGGAILNMGGILNVINSTFKNNHASFEGGAIYTTWSCVNFINSTLSNNDADKNAGAMYFDKGVLTILDSIVNDNKVLKESDDVAGAVYANDAVINFINSTFNNGGMSLYANFADVPTLVNITQNNDVFSLKNTDYIVSVENKGIKLNLTKNSIIVDKLPSKYDSRDWGWVSPVKKQGNNDDCWAFATVASLESSLLKSTGILYNLSENFVQQYQLKYDISGDLRNVFTGFSYSGLGYVLSWNGALLMKTPYDDRGLIGKSDSDESRIHVQDAMIIFGGKNNTFDLIKQAIMKYGSVSVQEIENSSVKHLNLTGDNIAVMDHSTHFISLIGWDDNEVSKDNYTGVWISKDSLTGYDKISYNDSTLFGIDNFAIVPQRAAIAYIFENNIDYHVNYQTDITGLTGFDGNYTQYSNEFISKYNELIGAVGTYFNDSGIKYSFDIYVNGVKVHTQNGISEFAGFRTIVLNKYIPVKTGDKFKVVFKSNALPYQAFSRQHYLPDMTFVSADGKSWSDFTVQNKTVCLKVYTVADDTKMIGNRNIAVDYLGGSYFSVKVVTANGKAVGAGEVVRFTIAGKSYLVKTDNNGIAKIKISNLPKKYTITTTYKGKSVKNTVLVRHVITANKLTVRKTAKSFILKAKVKVNGKLIKGKYVVFKFNGKNYKIKTNKNGIAQLVINKKIINKLKKGRTYTAYASYYKDTIKTTVKIR